MNDNVTSFQTWAGTQEAHHILALCEEKYSCERPDLKAFFDGDDTIRHPDFSVPVSRKGLLLLERHSDVAVIKVHGTLVSSHQWWHAYEVGNVTSYEAISDALQIAAMEQGVKEIYLDEASGGGYTRGVDVVSQLINRIDKIKPVFAHTDSHMLSAAYWLGCSARRITASRMAEVGSIGTYAVVRNISRAVKAAGVDYYIFKAGKYKGVGAEQIEMSEEAKAYFQDNVEKANRFFLEHVSLRRNLLMSEQDNWAEGRTFFAEEAKAAGLIDRVASLADLIGSGASKPTTSDNRRSEMDISAEKLAQIAAGADPESVLTAEELTQYKATLQKPDTTGEVKPSTQAEGDQAGTQAEGEPAVQASVDSQSNLAEMAKLLKENGRLEAKLEDLQAKHAALQKELESRDSQLSALLAVAQTANNMLQTALGKPKVSKSSPAEVVAQYNELQAEMAARFKVGQQTKLPTEDQTPKQIIHSFRR